MSQMIGILVGRRGREWNLEETWKAQKKQSPGARDFVHCLFGYNCSSGTSVAAGAGLGDGFTSLTGLGGADLVGLDAAPMSSDTPLLRNPSLHLP